MNDGDDYLLTIYLSIFFELWVQSKKLSCSSNSSIVGGCSEWSLKFFILERRKAYGINARNRMEW